MKMTYEIDRDILVVNQNGVTDEDEMIETLKTALADPRLAPGTHLLWNAKEAPAQASAEKMQALLRSFAPVSGKLSTRMAVVVTTQLQYGVGRMFAVYAEQAGTSVAVFYDFDEAKSWLRE